MAKYDLILKGGRVVDPSQGLDAPLDLAVAGGRVAALAAAIPSEDSDRVVDVSGKLVLPGLVDLHTHAYWGVCEYGIDPDTNCLPNGVTTVLDVGSAGSITFPAFRRFIIEPARTRVLALMHVNTMGMTHTVGELIGQQYLDPERTAAAAKEHSDIVIGIKVRLSRNVAGERDWEAFTAARKAADVAALPLMVHFGDSFTPLPRVLDELGPGDILTHCFTGRRNNILGEDGRVLPAVWAAARRGVYFDVGHGMGSFSFQVARTALEQGFLPTTISSDLHAYSAAHPVVNLLTTMTKFVHLGVPLQDVIQRSTSVPARLLGLEGKIGTLKPGAEADVAVVRELEGEFKLWDCMGDSLVSSRLLSPVLTLRAGRLC
mgnify:CR=1 FL=1